MPRSYTKIHAVIIAIIMLSKETTKLFNRASKASSMHAVAPCALRFTNTCTHTCIASVYMWLLRHYIDYLKQLHMHAFKMKRKTLEVPGKC